MNHTDIKLTFEALRVRSPELATAPLREIAPSYEKVCKAEVAVALTAILAQIADGDSPDRNCLNMPIIRDLITQIRGSGWRKHFCKTSRNVGQRRGRNSSNRRLSEGRDPC